MAARKVRRRANDFYPTPPDALRYAIPLEWAERLPSWKVLEPACGEGHLLGPLVEAGATVVAADKFDYQKEWLTPLGDTKIKPKWCVDFLTQRARPERHKYDLCVTNPPFSLAESFIRQSRRQSHRTMMLVRSTLFGSFERINFWQDDPPDAQITLVPRPQFTKNKDGKLGSDSSEYAWLIWSAPGDPPLSPFMWCRWKERRQRRSKK